MDQTLVDVTDIPDVRAGETATVIGTSGSESVSAYDLAEQTNTITNEVLSRLGARTEKTPVQSPLNLWSGHTASRPAALSKINIHASEAAWTKLRLWNRLRHMSKSY